MHSESGARDREHRTTRAVTEQGEADRDGNQMMPVHDRENARQEDLVGQGTGRDQRDRGQWDGGRRQIATGLFVQRRVDGFNGSR